jgi:hypothetical protein
MFDLLLWLDTSLKIISFHCMVNTFHTIVITIMPFNYFCLKYCISIKIENLRTSGRSTQEPDEPHLTQSLPQNILTKLSGYRRSKTRLACYLAPCLKRIAVRIESDEMNPRVLV